MDEAALNDAEIKIKALRVKGEREFFFFASEICEFGLNPNPDGPHITADQRELCEFLQAIYENNFSKIQQLVFKSLEESVKKEKGITKPEDIKVDEVDSLVLCPRGTLKSTVLQAFALWIACKNPDTRILFYGEVHEQAQKRLAVLKQVITSCRTFRLCYGNLDGSSKKLPWNENIAVLANRKNMAIREATFETAGLEPHFPLFPIPTPNPLFLPLKRLPLLRLPLLPPVDTNFIFCSVCFLQ